MVSSHMFEGCKVTTLEAGSVFTGNATTQLSPGKWYIPKRQRLKVYSWFLVTFDHLLYRYLIGAIVTY